MNEVMTYLNNGIAVIALIAAYFAGSKVVKWVGENVVCPVKDAAINHLTETTTAVKSLSESIPAMHRDIKDIRESLEDTCQYSKRQ